MTTKLSVGIVTYNNIEVIGETLGSLETCLPEDWSAQIVVYDNASSDGTTEHIAKRSRENAAIHLVASTENHGFGVAHNRILERVDAPYHMICNPDIVMHPGSLETMLALLESDDRIAVVSPKFLNPDATLQRLNHPHPAILDLFLRRFAPSFVRARFTERQRRYEMRHKGYDTMYDLDFASGAFMACRTAALREVGGFDPRYFLYFEDADLTRSLQKRGWRSVFCPDAVVTHQWKRDAHKNYRGALLMLASAMKYFHKWGWRLY
jgi:GT2 family glycosyltransferase